MTRDELNDELFSYLGGHYGLPRELVDELMPHIDAHVQAENEALKRGGAELGKVVHRMTEDIVRLTDSRDLIDENGDGDFGAMWDRLHETYAAGKAARAKLDAVRDLHKPEKRWHDGSGEWSVDTPEECFEVCHHCGQLEVNDQAPDVSFRDSLWPCATIRAIGGDGDG
jgi:hypothetical protein